MFVSLPFFHTYGMRGPGEIDLTRDRWEEKPTQLIPLLLSNIRVLEPGEHRRKFEESKQESEEKEADRLVQSGVLKQKEDVFYLYLDELEEVVRTHQVDYAQIDERKAAFKRNEKLTPPRIITSGGHVPSTQSLKEDIPERALSGVPVSSGVMEGRARVVLSIQDAEVEAGDILVTRFTDPSWTPLFATVHGLVTEIGGFTTHGAIVAREYGLPGVVGVENATQKIQDEQRIRVNGIEGYVEIVEETD